MRRETAAIAFGVLIALAVVYGAYRGYPHPPPNGFGSNWQCSDNPYADVCVKRRPP